jgi:peptidoglycan/LPS O-acetylase OafA/YrhL
MVARYKELDALRGIAALSVVLFHFTLGREQAEYGFKLGVTGVDLFFIISGFVIFMSINKVKTTSEFFVNRFSRLYPTYWTCVTFTFLIKTSAHYFLPKTEFISKSTSISLWEYFGNMTMFQYYLGIRDIDGPYWTMIIEMLFYILIAIIFSLKKIKYILPIGFSILLVTIINEIWLKNYFPVFQKIQTIFPLFIHFPLFLAGILFYKIAHTVDRKQNAFYYGCLLVCFVVRLTLFDDLNRISGNISFTLYLMVLTFYFLLFILFVNNKLSFIVSRPTLFLGKISFALYLIHQYISTGVILPGLIKYAHLNFWIAALIALPTIILLAAAITYYIEIPFGKKTNNKLRTIFGLQMRE